MQRTISGVSKLVAGSLVLAGCGFGGFAQSVSEFAVQVSANVQSNPAQIELVWPSSSLATGHAVFRKDKNSPTWGEAVILPGSAGRYLDTNVVSGSAYEYRVWRTTPNYFSHGYVYAGIDAPLLERRGKLLLLVENTYASDLAPELARLQQDLVGDGWTVSRHNVPRAQVDAGNADPSQWLARSNEVAAVKGLIRAEYLADPANARAVFLLGHLPVPYSGSTAPDNHPDHRGAWPADLFYGVIDGTWTDSSVRNTEAADARNRNYPGDGKFDQNHTPGQVKLEVGRVDMADLPAFPLSELDLLRQYLNKNHAYRHRLLAAQPRALVSDNLGVLLGEIPGVAAWANFAPLVGSGNTEAGRWLSVLTKDAYLWSYGSGSGSFTRAAGVADTWHFLVYDIKVVFAMLFGSYFGDWDSQNNLLRAPLAMSTHTLNAVWGGRPNWFFHHMALGETIGYSTRLSQNNAGLYPDYYKTREIFIGMPSDNFTNGVHMALMGDPSLRMQVVAPPVSLDAARDDGGVDLSWSPPADAVLGYHVYRAPSPGGPYSRLNATLISGASYRDEDVTSERHYMVRAVKLESSPSGTFYNASQGAFLALDPGTNPGDGGTWAGRGSGIWKISDATGTAGSDEGWDLVEIEGTLEVTATSTDQFTVAILSVNSENLPAPPANFDYNHTYTWPLVTASAIEAFEPEKINLLTSEFRSDLGGGVFSLALSEDSRSVNLVFTPNRPPVTRPSLFTRPLDTPLRLEIQELLTTFTSDPDGDARALLQFGASTNGTAISTEGSFLVFKPSNNLPETLTYWVQDVRPYRPGDTVRIAQGIITIVPVPETLPFSAYHAIEIEWQGQPGTRYQLQSRLETEAQWTNQGEPFLGTGEKTSLFERTSAATKFYRIVALDPVE